MGGSDLTKTKLLGGLNVSIDSGKSLTHCECSSHSFIASRSGTHRTTEEQARVRGVRIRVPEERLRLMRIEKYGTGGEKLSRAQMQLFELEPILWAQPNMPRQERFKMAGHQRKRIISTEKQIGTLKDASPIGHSDHLSVCRTFWPPRAAFRREPSATLRNASSPVV